MWTQATDVSVTVSALVMCHPSTQHLPFTRHQENLESDSEDDDANIPDLEEVPTNMPWWVDDSETDSELNADMPILVSDDDESDDDDHESDDGIAPRRTLEQYLHARAAYMLYQEMTDID